MAKKLDLIGQKFGKLTVISTAGHLIGRKKTTRAWLCQCECGNTTVVGTNELTGGNTTTCGCGHSIDETGNRYGRLLVIGRGDKPNGQGASWLCRCDCGKEFVTRGSALRSGVSASCGCSATEKLRAAIMLPEGVAAMNQIIRRTKSNALERGYEYNLSREQLIELMGQDCHYCGAKPSNRSRHPEQNGEFIYNGIDRVDNSKGYDMSNVVPCCKHCNIAKRDRSASDFLKWIEQVYRYSVLEER